MAQEIERKYLIDLEKAGDLGGGTHIRQAYVPTTNRTAVRVRIADDQAYLTIKGERAGATRLEFEYSIPVPDAEEILSQLCTDGQIDKTRYVLAHGEHEWEIDVFHGENEGLVVAEVEMGSEDEDVDLPDWIVEDVTNDDRYYNFNLLRNPYKTWSQP